MSSDKARLDEALSRLHAAYSDYPLNQRRFAPWYDAMRGLEVVAVERVVGRAAELWERMPSFALVRREVQKLCHGADAPRNETFDKILAGIGEQHGIGEAGEGLTPMLAAFPPEAIYKTAERLAGWEHSYGDWHEILRHLELDAAGVDRDDPCRRDPLAEGAPAWCKPGARPSPAVVRQHVDALIDSVGRRRAPDAPPPAETGGASTGVDSTGGDSG